MWRIYNQLYQSPRKTPNETVALIEQSLGRRVNKPSYTPRFAVLAKARVLNDLGTRRCSISGKECHYYEITNFVPDGRVRDARPVKEKAYRVVSGNVRRWYSEADKKAAEQRYSQLEQQGHDVELTEFVRKKVLKTTDT